MDIYLKAGIITLVVFLAGVLLVRGLDEARMGDINQQVNDVVLEAEATKLLFLYPQVFGDNSSELCPALAARTKAQMDKTFKVYQQLQEAERNNLLSDYDTVKRRYYLTNFELYLYLEQAKRQCQGEPNAGGVDELEPLLFFYSLDQQKCPDCLVQGPVLDSVRDECGNVRVFAFPVDSGEPLLDALVDRFGVNATPTVVTENGRVLAGLQSKDKIKAVIRCEAAPPAG